MPLKDCIYKRSYLKSKNDDAVETYQKACAFYCDG